MSGQVDPTSIGQMMPAVGASTVECRGLTKRYGSHIALNSVDLTLRAGEFVALLGPNGAGKSTLIKLLDAIIAPDGGSVRFADGVRAGVIHQDLGLFADMSVSENLFVGAGTGTGAKRLISFAQENRRTIELLKFVGLSGINPRTLVRDLTLGERALVAVAKLLSEGAGVIIVDEVTASLPRAEAAWLVEHLKTAARSGVTVIMVTHRFEDVLGNVDRYVVVVDGKIVMDRAGGGVERAHLVEIISTGSRSGAVETLERPARTEGDPVVSLVETHVNKIGPLSLSLHAGQITGVSGSSVSGFHDIAYLVAGVLKAQRGSVTRRRGTKVTCLPAHRDADGTFPDQTVEFNMSVGNTNRWRRSGLISLARMSESITSFAEDLNVVPWRTDAVITTLSGGNQQKVLLGRVIADDPGCVVLCEPTRGVDVATRREIYSVVHRLADDGCAVLVVSSDMEDLEALADRIVVINDEGRVDKWVETDAIGEFSRTASVRD